MTERLLLGSGPSPVPRSVLDALARPTLGHLDPAFTEILDSCRARLREVFRTAYFRLNRAKGEGQRAKLTDLFEGL